MFFKSGDSFLWRDSRQINVNIGLWTNNIVFHWWHGYPGPGYPAFFTWFKSPGANWKKLILYNIEKVGKSNVPFILLGNFCAGRFTCIRLPSLEVRHVFKIALLSFFATHRVKVSVQIENGLWPMRNEFTCNLLVVSSFFRMFEQVHDRLSDTACLDSFNVVNVEL